MLLFWIIFGTASFTALVIIVAIALIVLTSQAKAQKYARKHGYCPNCGAIRMTTKQMSRKGAIGFKGNQNE